MKKYIIFPIYLIINIGLLFLSQYRTFIFDEDILYITKSYDDYLDNISNQDERFVIINFERYPLDTILKQMELIQDCQPFVLGIHINFLKKNYAPTIDVLNKYDKLVLISIFNDSFEKPPTNAIIIENKIFGHVNLEYSGKFLFGEYYPVVEYDGGKINHFSIEVARLYDSTLQEQDLSTEAQLIRYTANGGNFKIINGINLLESYSKEELCQLLQDKIVLMGYTGIGYMGYGNEAPNPEVLNKTAREEDIHDTPLGYMYGVVLLANMIKSHLDRDYIVAPIKSFQMGSILLSIVISSFLFVIHVVVFNFLKKRLLRILASILILVLMEGLVIYLTFQFQIILNMFLLFLFLYNSSLAVRTLYRLSMLKS